MTKNILVLGLGKSGIAVARHVLCNKDNLTIYAGASSDKTKAVAKEFLDSGVEVVFDCEQVQGHYDLCVVCPGIPQTSEFYKSAQAASDELISEPEFAFRLSPQDWIAVTGTNGKTTCTSCIAHVFNECGKNAYACGNIGETTTESVERRREDETLVAEMSSYQLASSISFSPRTACLLNITPDHLSWHGSLLAYAQAKFKIFQNLYKGQSAIICEGIDGIEPVASELIARGVRVVWVGSKRSCDCAYEQDNKLIVEIDGIKHTLCTIQDLQIKGKHNVLNALVVASVAIDYGFDDMSVATALCSFEPLEHRIEPVATIDGIAFFNDSKATNVDASLQALTAFPGQGIHLLLGGTDKGTSLDELVEACKDTCVDIICYGDAGQRFYDAFESSSLPRVLCKNMREAFDYACEHAKSGEVVLLSPSCASFDEFDSFIHRGKVFKSWVFEKAERQ